MAKDLSPEQWYRIVTLINSVWPSADETIEAMVQHRVERYQKEPDTEVFVVWDKENAIAHLRIFPRRIASERGEMNIMALAGVCVLNELRGRGLGKMVVDAAFSKVRSGRFPASVFQTGVPDFYRRLGAVTVDNEFFNSKNTDEPGKSPWWEDFIMVYPGSFDWPEGRIDLNGPGY